MKIWLTIGYNYWSSRITAQEENQGFKTIIRFQRNAILQQRYVFSCIQTFTDIIITSITKLSGTIVFNSKAPERLRNSTKKNKTKWPRPSLLYNHKEISVHCEEVLNQLSNKHMKTKYKIVGAMFEMKLINVTLI